MGSAPSQQSKQFDRSKVNRINIKGKTQFNHNNSLSKEELQLQDEDKSQIAEVMNHHSLFSIFSNQERSDCVHYFRKWTYTCGMYIYRQYDISEDLYIIKAGSVSVEIDCSVVKSLGENQYFGQDTLCFESPRSQSIRVITERIIVYSIRRQQLMPSMKRTMSEYKEDISSIFNRIHFFNYLTNKERKFLIQNTSLFRLSKGEVLFEKEQDANSFYIVKKGTIIIEIQKKKDILMVEGEYFGESAFLSLLNNSNKSQRMGKASANQQGMLIYAIGLNPVKKCLGHYIRSIIFYNQQKWALYRDDYLNSLQYVDYHYLLQLFNVKEGRKYSVLAKKNTQPKYLFIPLQVEINTCRDLKIYGTQYLKPQNQDEKLNNDIILTDTGYYAYALLQEFKQVLFLHKKSTIPAQINLKLLKQPLYVNMTLTLRNISRFSKKLTSSLYSTVLIVQDMKFGNQFVVKIYKKAQINRSASHSDLSLSQLVRKDKFAMKSFKIINYNELVVNRKDSSGSTSVRSNLLDDEDTKVVVGEDIIIREKQLIANICNRFICGYYKAQQDQNNYYLFLEYIRGLSLEEIFAQFGVVPNSVIKYILASIASALDYLHSQRVVYRNLNTTNTLIRSNGNLSLVDFSCAKQLGRTHKTGTLIGCPYYMAPQMVSKVDYSYSVDVWSMGVILYEMMTGTLPFGYGMSDPIDIYHSILNDQLDIDKVGNKNGKILVKALLQKNPVQRQRTPLDIRKFAYINDLQFDWQKFQAEQLDPPYFPKKTSSSYTNVNNYAYFDASTIQDWS